MGLLLVKRLHANICSVTVQPRSCRRLSKNLDPSLVIFIRVWRKTGERLLRNIWDTIKITSIYMIPSNSKDTDTLVIPKRARGLGPPF